MTTLKQPNAPKWGWKKSWANVRPHFLFIAVPLPAVMCDFWFLNSCLSIIYCFVIALSDVNQDLINNTICFSFYSFVVNFYIRIALSYLHNRCVALKAILKYILINQYFWFWGLILLYFLLFRSMPLVPLKCVTESWEGSLKYRVRNTGLFLATFADSKSLCFFRILKAGSRVKLWQRNYCL